MKVFTKFQIFIFVQICKEALCRSCTDKAQTATIPKGLSETPVVLVLATVGSDTELPCHYCTENPNTTGRIWRKRNLHGIDELVKLDMHDDDSKNRIYVNREHTLFIKAVSEDDGAYYFCYDTEDPHGQAKMDILLDVGYRSALAPSVLNSPANLDREVPRLFKDCDKLRNIPPVSMYKCYSEWGPWSQCDTCGKKGKRRRLGECRLQKMAKAEMESSSGQKITADFPIVGVGCHSVLLNAVKKAKEILNKIPNIVLVGECEVSCADYVQTATAMTAHKKHSFLSKIKMKEIKRKKVKPQTVTAIVKEEREGISLTLFCPGASLNTPVRWKFRNKLLNAEKLKDKSQGRVSIDALDALHIKDLRATDAGEYICTLYDVEIGMVRLKVISKHVAFDPTTNFGILTITMVFSFTLWILLMAVKCKAHHMQLRAQKRKESHTSISSENSASSQSLLLESEEDV